MGLIEWFGGKAEENLPEPMRCPECASPDGLKFAPIYRHYLVDGEVVRRESGSSVVCGVCKASYLATKQGVLEPKGHKPPETQKTRRVDRDEQKVKFDLMENDQPWTRR